MLCNLRFFDDVVLASRSWLFTAVGGAIADIFGGLYFSFDVDTADDDGFSLVLADVNLANDDASGL